MIDWTSIVPNTPTAAYPTSTYPENNVFGAPVSSQIQQSVKATPKPSSQMVRETLTVIFIIVALGFGLYVANHYLSQG